MQYIRGKPIRFGFKLWAMCESRGWMARVEPYCGSHTHLPDYDLGQGPNVVLGLVEAAEVPPGGKIYFDNLFTSLPLLDKLSEKGIGGTGTLRQNRLGPIPLPKKKEVEKNFARGEMEVLLLLLLLLL